MEQRESAAEKQTSEKRIRRSSIAGIIGCIFFGIGDWLLGWVESGIVDRSFLLIREGHGGSLYACQPLFHRAVCVLHERGDDGLVCILSD